MKPMKIRYDMVLPAVSVADMVFCQIRLCRFLSRDPKDAPFLRESHMNYSLDS